jgi:hypothetical protein
LRHAQHAPGDRRRDVDDGVQILLGADTMYSLRTRVRPSSRTATIIGPEVTSAMSTGTACGLNASASMTASATAAAAQNSVRNLILTT